MYFNLQVESRTDVVVLNCQHFTWNKNPFSRKFQDLKTALEFVARFNTLLQTITTTDGEGEGSKGGEEADEVPSAKQPRISGDEDQGKQIMK